jgi:ABC-type Na+ transport system ATPase subunit NatA
MLSVELDRASRRFGSTQALGELSFGAPQGAITAVLGPNGAGKTTALRLITGALEPDSGRVSVFGLDPASTPWHCRLAATQHLLAEADGLAHHVVVEPCQPTLEDLYFAIRAQLQPSAPTLSHGPIAEPALLARAGRP